MKSLFVIIFVMYLHVFMYYNYACWGLFLKTFVMLDKTTQA